MLELLENSSRVRTYESRMFRAINVTQSRRNENPNGLNRGPLCPGRLFQSAVPIDCSNRASPCVIASCGCYNYRYVSDTSAAAASTKAGKNSSDRHKRVLTVRGKARFHHARKLFPSMDRAIDASSRKRRGRNWREIRNERK